MVAITIEIALVSPSSFSPFLTSFISPVQHSEIQLYELPAKLLNQGYDLVCKARNHAELCLYNGSRTTFQTAVLKLGNKDGTTKTINIIQIKGKESNYCIKEFHTDYNSTHGNCINSISFDKDVWSWTGISGYSSGQIIELDNNTKNGFGIFKP